MIPQMKIKYSAIINSALRLLYKRKSRLNSLFLALEFHLIFPPPYNNEKTRIFFKRNKLKWYSLYNQLLIVTFQLSKIRNEIRTLENLLK